MKIPTRPDITVVLAAALLCFLAGPFAGAQAQEDDDDTLRIEIVRSNLRIPIAIPELQAGSSRFSEAARTIAEIIRADLRREEIFNLADPAVYNSIGPHSVTDISAIPFERYADYRMNAVLLGRVIPADGDRMRVEVRLFSVEDRNTLFGKGFTGSPDNVRQFAHRIAAHILYAFVGNFGIYDSKIFYTSLSEAGGGNQNSELWMMDWDGGNAFRITFGTSLKLFPDAGPNRSVAYTSFVNGNSDIYLLKPGAEEAISLFASPAGDMTPAISPDGNRVVFSSSQADGNTDIYVCNIDGSGVQRLTTNRAIDTNPCWSPDGRQIAFTSGRTGTVQIYRMNADGTGQQRITFEGRYNDGADWSPDGRYIAYAARRSGSKTFDLRIQDLTTGQSYYVTRDVANDESPSFSPDGRTLAFASDRTGVYQVWVIDIDGRNMKQVTFDGINKHPSWAP